MRERPSLLNGDAVWLARAWRRPAPSRTEVAMRFSALSTKFRDVTLHSHHRQLHSIALVADHTTIPHLDGNTVDRSRELEHLPA